MDGIQQFTDIGDDLMPAVQDRIFRVSWSWTLSETPPRQDPSPADRHEIILDDPLPEILVRDRRGVAKAVVQQAPVLPGPVAGTMQSTIELGKEQLASIQSARSDHPGVPARRRLLQDRSIGLGDCRSTGRSPDAPVSRRREAGNHGAKRGARHVGFGIMADVGTGRGRPLPR